MRTILKRRTILAALGLIVVGAGFACADDDDDDHYQARRALEEGRARPLVEILERVRDRLGGEIVGVEFEREDGQYVYEFKVITPAGKLREVHVDALSGEVLKSEDD